MWGKREELCYCFSSSQLKTTKHTIPLSPLLSHQPKTRSKSLPKAIRKLRLQKINTCLYSQIHTCAPLGRCQVDVRTLFKSPDITRRMSWEACVNFTHNIISNFCFHSIMLISSNERYRTLAANQLQWGMVGNRGVSIHLRWYSMLCVHVYMMSKWQTRFNQMTWKHTGSSLSVLEEC